jgi:ABC-type Fe3+ transport system substrate-binding protein
VAIHNAHYGPPPATWSDLASERFRDRLVFEAPWEMVTTGPAVAELAGAMPESVWQRLIEGMTAGNPLIVGDNERSVTEVATGGRWAGLSNWNVARRVRQGSPVRHGFLDPTPCVPGFGAVVEGAPGQELAHRFLGWLAGEAGQRAYAATGRIPAWLDLDVPTSLDRVIPAGTARLHGGDWVSHTHSWAKRLRELFGAPPNELASGKPAS